METKHRGRGRSPTTTPEELFDLLYKLGGGLLEKRILTARLRISAATLSRLKRKLIEQGRLACLYSNNYCCYILVDDRLAALEAKRSEQSLKLRPFRRFLITRKQLKHIAEIMDNVSVEVSL